MSNAVRLIHWSLLRRLSSSRRLLISPLAISRCRRCVLAKYSIAAGELSVRMTVPMDMKKLQGGSAHSCIEKGRRTYPNVAAEPAMYCPSVLITPLGPAPYLKMFVAPSMVSVESRGRGVGFCCTKYEANDDSHRCNTRKRMASEKE